MSDMSFIDAIVYQATQGKEPLTTTIKYNIQALVDREVCAAQERLLDDLAVKIPADRPIPQGTFTHLAHTRNGINAAYGRFRNLIESKRQALKERKS